MRSLDVCFNEEIVRGQETDFFCSLFFKSQSSNFLIHTDKLHYYRTHDESKSSQNSKKQEYLMSRMQFFLVNLKRSIVLKDNDLYNRLLKKCISTLFDMLLLKQKDNFVKSKNQFNLILNSVNKKLLIRFNLITTILFTFGKHSYSLRKHLLSKDYSL